MKQLVVDNTMIKHDFVGLRLEQRDNQIVLRVTDGFGKDRPSGALMRFKVDVNGKIYGVVVPHVDDTAVKVASEMRYLYLDWE